MCSGRSTEFLQEDMGLVVEERRHAEVTHLARVISVHDMLEQIAARCPPSTPIPYRPWLSLQFWTKNKHAQLQVHYTGRFNVKYMIHVSELMGSSSVFM